MFDYAFANFTKVFLKDQKKAEGISSYEDEEAYIVLPSGADFSSVQAEVTITDKTKAAGTVAYTYQGQNVGSASVTLTEEYIKEKTGYNITPEITGSGAGSDNADGNKEGLSLAAKIVIGITAGVILFFVLVYAYLRYRLAMRRKRRMMRARRRRQAQTRYQKYDTRAKRNPDGNAGVYRSFDRRPSGGYAPGQRPQARRPQSRRS